MKNLLIVVFIISFLLMCIPSYASSKKHTPLRYTNHERNLKHAGMVRRKTVSADIMNLNYRTGAGLNYNTGAVYKYDIPSGLNYRPATNLRYR